MSRDTRYKVKSFPRIQRQYKEKLLESDTNLVPLKEQDLRYILKNYNRFNNVVQGAVTTIPNLYHIFSIDASQGAGGAGSYPSIPARSLTPMTDVVTLTDGPLSPNTTGVFIPLVEGDTYNQDAVPQSVSNIETQATALGQQLKLFLNDDSKICVTIHYRGGTSIQLLSQGGANASLGYDQAIAAVARVKELATGYNYVPIFSIFTSGNGANPYDTGLTNIINQVRAGVLPYYSGTLNVLLNQPRIVGTPDLSNQVYSVCNTLPNVYLTFSYQDVLLSSEIQADGIHITNYGQGRMGVNNAIAIEEIIKTGNHVYMKLDVDNTVYDSGANTLTIPVLGSTGTIVGTGDFGMKITHPDLVTIIGGTWAVSGTNIVFTMTTNIPIVTTVITVNIMFGTGTLRDSRTKAGVAFYAADILPYTVNRKMTRSITTKSIAFITIPAVLSNPTDINTSSSTATVTVDTNFGAGTLYWVVSTFSTQPSAFQIKNGQNYLGGTETNGNQVISATGTQNIPVTGLTPSTQYYTHFIQVSNAVDSNKVSADGFATTAISYTATGKVVGINFVGTTLVNTQAGYNNLVNPQPPTIALLLNDDVTSSGFSVLMGGNWGAGNADNGETSVDFPVNVTLRSSAGNAGTEAVLTLQGLDPTKAYDLNTLHSRSGVSGGTLTVAHEGLTTNSRTLDTQENNAGVPATYNVMKSVKIRSNSSNIVVRMTRVTDPFYRINGLIITEYSIT